MLIVCTKAQLAMTDEDHRIEGHDPPPMLRDNPGVTLEQVLTASHGLTNFIEHQMRDTTESYESALRGNGPDERFLKIMLAVFLGPNITYLRRIGKLPNKFHDLDLATKFSLPKK